MAAPPDAFAAAFLDACAVQKSASGNRPPEIIGVFRHFWTAIVQKCALSRNAETRSSRREAERQDTFELHRPQGLRRSAPDAGTDPRSASRHRLPGRTRLPPNRHRPATCTDPAFATTHTTGSIRSYRFPAAQAVPPSRPRASAPLASSSRAGRKDEPRSGRRRARHPRFVRPHRCARCQCRPLNADPCILLCSVERTIGLMCPPTRPDRRLGAAPFRVPDMDLAVATDRDPSRDCAAARARPSRTRCRDAGRIPHRRGW